MSSELENYLQAKSELINKALDEWLPAVATRPSIIHEAMRYTVLGGGKRLRGILVLAVAEALGKDSRQVLPIAASIELLHAYSLIHDDLPCMDDDDLRRGQPTSHRVYGEAIALLAGDGLLTRSFEVLSAMCDGSADAEASQRLLRIISEVARAAGTCGLIAGQVEDLQAEGREIDMDDLLYIHINKTGRLFKACIRASATWVGADERQLWLLTRYAECLGLVYQITDDILDVEGDSQRLGKAVGSDERKHKSTFASIYGVERARQIAAEKAREGIEAVRHLGDPARFLVQIMNFVLTREF